MRQHWTRAVGWARTPCSRHQRKYDLRMPSRPLLCSAQVMIAEKASRRRGLAAEALWLLMTYAAKHLVRLMLQCHGQGCFIRVKVAASDSSKEGGSSDKLPICIRRASQNSAQRSAKPMPHRWRCFRRGWGSSRFPEAASSRK